MISSNLPNLNRSEQLIINLGRSPIASLIWVGTDPDRQNQLLEAMGAIARSFKLQSGYVGAALHKGRSQGSTALSGQWSSQDTGRHVALYSQWESETAFLSAMERSTVQECFSTAWELAPELEAIARNPRSTLFEVAIVDRNDNLSGSPIAIGQAAPFINFFPIPEGKQQVLVEHFRETIPVVKKALGYLATNAHLSLDGCHFFNYGQYDTVEHFRAIFNEPDAIKAFASFPKQGFVPELHTYEVVWVDVA